MDKHGGEISLISAEEGLGSTTTIRLPFYLAYEIEDVELFDIENGRNYLPERNNASIYHIDTTELPTSGMPNSRGDSSFDALLMSTTLEKSGNDTETIIKEKSDDFKVKSRSVLVVGDSAPTRKSFRCDQAEDGSVAVKLVRRQLAAAAAAAESSPQTLPYDLILMDYQMPIMDGPSAISDIRNLGYYGGAILTMW